MKTFLPDAGTLDVTRVTDDLVQCDHCIDDFKDGYWFNAFIKRVDNALVQERVPIYRYELCDKCFEAIYGGQYPLPPDTDVDVSGGIVSG